MKPSFQAISFLRAYANEPAAAVIPTTKSDSAVDSLAFKPKT